MALSCRCASATRVMGGEDVNGGVGVTAMEKEQVDVKPFDVPSPDDDLTVPSWPIADAFRQVLLVVWKNVQLRGNRPLATILEVLFPLIAFVALAVLTPRNEYFDAGYSPNAPWMPPACVLQHDVPTNLTTIDANLIPTVCPDAGHLQGPHVIVPFAPDTDEVRLLMTAACELRYHPPGVDIVGYSHTTVSKRRRLLSWEGKSASGGSSAVKSSSTKMSDTFRRRLLFGPSDPPSGPPSPPSPPAPPAWPACSLQGYADQETMARAVQNGAAGGRSNAVAVFFTANETEISGYEIRGHSNSDPAVLEMQERLGDVFVALAGTGDIATLSTTLAQNPPTANLYRQFPLEPVYPAGAFTFVAKFLPLAVVVTWTYTLLVCAGGVAYEREKGLEAAMRACGLPLWTHWAGHGIVCALLLGAAALFCGATVTSFGASLFVTGDSGRFVFLLLALTVCASVSGCFVVATLASDSSTAAAVTAIVWLVSYLPYAAVSGLESGSNTFGSDKSLIAFSKTLVCFLPASAQGLGFSALAQWEASGAGVTWAALWDIPPVNASGDIGVPLGLTFLTLLIDAVGLAFLALMFDARRFRTRDLKRNVTDGVHGNDSNVQSAFGIVASNLSVTYPAVDGGCEKAALKNVSLNCPKNEITVLLGHNGAGKSSCISRLVGAAPPSSGTTTISGFNSTSEYARKLLGFCPQHDTLWDDLTVQDHLDFVLRLRGVTNKKDLEEKRNTLLKEVELRAKKRTVAGALSGGMRRRLSVALAFAGDPPNVILDEPTAGVDPRARRQIQNLLLKKAKSKAVLITTHHLDEAERLGTRVAVLHAGELICSGSSTELKQKYDVGYRVVVTVCPSEKISKNQIAQALVDAFNGQIPTTNNALVTREGAEGSDEISLNVPMSLSESLPSALRLLKSTSGLTHELGVTGYGLTAPNLDGVFRAVQRENTEKYSVTLDEGNVSECDVAVGPSVKGDGSHSGSETKGTHESSPIRKQSSWWSVVFATAAGSVSDFKRDKSRIMATFVAPCVLLLAASAMAEFKPAPSTYDLSYNVPVPDVFIDSGSTNAFLFSCETDDTTWSSIESDFASRGEFGVEWIDPVSVDPSTCYAEKSMYAHLRQSNPSGLRRRRDLGSVGVALGAGDDTDAATVWWSSYRLARAATAALNRAEAYARLSNGISTNAFDASQLVTATSAANAVDLESGDRPWPKTNDATRRSILSSSPGPATAAAAALLAVSLPPCLAAAAAAKARASGLRRVLLVAGASKTAHWVGIFLGDVVVLAPATALHIIAITAMGWRPLGGSAGIADITAILFTHVFAATTTAHTVATYIGEDSAPRALPSCLLASALPATFFTGLTYALDALGDVNGANIVFSLASIFPGYLVSQGFVEVSVRSAFGRILTVENGKDFELNGSAFVAEYEARGGGVSGLLTAALIVGFVGLVLLSIVDGSSGVRAVVEQCVSSEVDVRKAIEAEGTRDADVVEEEDKLKQITGHKNTADDVETGRDSSTSDYALRLLGLRKSYLGSTKPAVRDLWLEVAPGQCFGLLGINGCGKTTTFRMAAGDLPPTLGRVEIKGDDGSSSKRNKKSSNAVGYCPQRDAIIGTLTVVEHLWLVAAARGIGGGGGAVGDKSAQITAAIANAGLTQFTSVRAGSLSGGNKRKLCLAMALLGLENYGLALLDEPTAGVDPDARDVITEQIREAARERKCAVVVTSHAVEDVSVLCQKVGVMVDGALLCLGAPQGLRQKHGKVLTLTIHATAGFTGDAKDTKSEENLKGTSSSENYKNSSDSSLDAFVKRIAPGAVRVSLGCSSDDASNNDSKQSSDKAARMFGFVEDNAELEEAKAVAREGAIAAEQAAEASPVWELPASAVEKLPDILEALEKRKKDGRDDVEGYAVGQATLEDVFLDFASRGAAQSDAQQMAMEDALFAHRLRLSKKQ